MKDLKERGLGLAVISYDPPQILTAFSKQHGIAFPMLSDVGSETIKRYGILNTVAMELTGPNAKDPALTDDIKTYVSVVGANPRMAGIAFPGTFILDRSGRVKSRFFEDFYITRNTVSSILARTGTGNPVAGTKISTERLDVTAYPSDAAIAPGNRITLTFDIVPHRGVHVYAPGASSYRVIAIKLRVAVADPRAADEVSLGPDLLLQAAERARARLRKAVHALARCRAGRNAAGADGTSRQGVADPQCDARVSSVR